MKKHHNLFINCLGLCLIALSNVITLTSAFALFGEPDVPKSMLK